MLRVPRAGQVKSSGERLSDRIAIGVLTKSFPAALVDEVVAETGRLEQRSRLLPARVVVYFVLAMCLFAGQGYEEVARLLTDGLPGARRWQGSWRVPTTAAIWRARARLGAEPLKALFGRVCRPVATSATVGAFYRGWHLVAVDSTTFDLPDTTSNVDYFGRPASPHQEAASAFPQVRLAALAECGSHTIFAAQTGPLNVGETTLARQLWPSLTPGMLLLADRGFHGVGVWKAAAATGADLLWRIRNTTVLPVTELLADGSYLSKLFDGRDKRHLHGGTDVRVIEYTLGSRDTVYRLVTTILDPQAAPAHDLAALYAQRWEIESTLDELKTHQGGPRLVLRSQHPVGVEQEVYGFLLIHHAIRQLMLHAAHESSHDPDRMSFTRTLRIARRQVTDQAAFSPRQTRSSDPRNHH